MSCAIYIRFVLPLQWKQIISYKEGIDSNEQGGLIKLLDTSCFLAK
mgnify:FL=1